MKIENPILGEHIRLRPLIEADLPLKVKWYNDPDIRKTLIVDEQFELDRTLEWFEANKDSKARIDLVIEADDGKPIGLICLVNIDRSHKTAEIIIVIGDKDYWGKGVMLEAESLLINYAFSQMRLEKIWAQARTNNIASIITMKKLGFQIKETLLAHAVIAGRTSMSFMLFWTGKTLNLWPPDKMKSMIHQTIETCKQLIDNPGVRKEYLLGMRHNSHGLVGYFSNYIPQEIIAAAGFHPLRIIGSFQSSQPHRHKLFNPICSFIQDVYAAAGSGEFAMLDYIVFPNSCDSLKVMTQLWNSEIKKAPAYTVLHPVNTGADSIRYFADQLNIFATHLQAAAGSEFPEASLVEVIEKYNLTRSLLRQLYHIRRTNKNVMLGSDLFALMTAGLIMDRDQYNRILAQIISQAKEFPSVENTGSANIMLIGPLLDNLQLLEKIEQCGAYILDDDVTNGSRYFDLDVRTQGDLYKNLAERYLRSGPSPTLHTDPQTDIQSFQDRVSELDLDGVLFINQKFCEPHVHNYLAKADCLKQLGIRSLMLEIEHNRSGTDERDLLRIESFLEVVAGGRRK